jgi:hypothetical protein
VKLFVFLRIIFERKGPEKGTFLFLLSLYIVELTQVQTPFRPTVLVLHLAAQVNVTLRGDTGCFSIRLLPCSTLSCSECILKGRSLEYVLVRMRVWRMHKILHLRSTRTPPTVLFWRQVAKWLEHWTNN